MAATAAVCDFGWKAPGFTLPGTDGRTYGLDDARGAKGTLVMFICNHCPYVQSVLDRIVRDTRELAAHGIGSMAISSNDAVAYPEDGFAAMAAVAKRMDFPFPYLYDGSQDVARAYGALCTPDFFGFDKNLGLQYRGRLDASRRTPVPGARRDLFEAMVGVARDGRGPPDQIPSVGCSIKWRRRVVPSWARR